MLQNHFHLGAGARGVVGTLANLGGVIGVIAGGTFGDRLFRRSPEGSMRLTVWLVAAFGVLLAAAVYMPNPVLYTVFSGLATGAAFCAFVPISTLVAAVTPYRLRSLGFATVGLYIALFRGIGGAVVVGQLATAFGDRFALAVAAVPASALGAILIARGTRHLRPDMAAAAADIIEEADELARVAAGGTVPVLQVRGLDFSYGALQVLFDVDLDVWPGEVLALLGTNGAGKSTLLRAISGLGAPDRGVIRLQGRTLTFAEPTERVRAGIVQVPGDGAVFPSVSVADNLRAGAYRFISDRKRLHARIEEVVDLFPALGDRMGQQAGTLSGGEQQMLGLAMAMLLDPSMLLIDELSLGLAPIVVQELLGVIERLKERGTTMVIVEQSINVALAVADRAVFMEKGRVRFEGRAADLLERNDLVRAVFFGGEGG